jgi:hypothetical protein
LIGVYFNQRKAVFAKIASFSFAVDALFGENDVPDIPLHFKKCYYYSIAFVNAFKNAIILKTWFSSKEKARRVWAWISEPK